MSALADYNKALEINPSSSNAAFSKAACLNKMGNYEEAILSYNNAFEIDNEKNNNN